MHLNDFLICQQAVGKVWARSRPTPPGSRTPRLEHRGCISGGSSGSWTFPGCLRSDWWGRLRCSWCWLTARKPATRNGADLQRIIASRDTFWHMGVTTIYFGGDVSPSIIGLLYCNMWHMICPPFMNPGCSLVDLLLFPIYFQFRKNKGNKTVWPPPLDCTLGWARKRRLAASFEKTAQFNCHWCLN